MPLAASTPRLLTRAGQPAAGATLEIPARGLALTVRLPQVSPAHLELTTARLVLGAPAGATSLSGGSPGLTVATNLGPLITNWSNEQAKDVVWLTADWGARRPLVAIQINTTWSDTTRPDPTLGRLKVSDGGPWFPPLPVETVPFNKEQALPDLMASRLMIEIVLRDSNGILQPAANRLKGLVLKFAGQPYDVKVAVGDAPPLFQRAGRLLPGQNAVVEEGLAEALNALAARDGAAADLPIRIEDSTQGRVTIASAELKAATVYTALDDPASQGGVPLAWEGEAIGRVTVGDGTVIDEVELTVAPDLVPERFALTEQSVTPSTRGQLCDPDHSAAQGFSTLAAGPLAGLDVLLQPTTARASGTLALHPEENGHPGPVPFTGAALPFQIDETSPPWAPRWVSLQLPKPLKLDGGRWWLVLTMTSGEVIWSVDANAPALGGEALPALLHRLGAGGWAPWDPPPGAPWGRCRLRVYDTAPPPSFQVTLHRNARSPVLVLVPDEGGHVVAGKSDLAALGTGGTTLEIAASSAGPPVSGAVRFERLRVVAHRP